MTNRLLLAVLMLSVSTPAMAAIDHSGHNMAPVGSKKLANNPSVKANIAAMKTMHEAMDICYVGDADIDFVRGMIPHHKGAVDMANVMLKYGKDEKLKALAKFIITWQEAEIGFMSQWLSVRESKYMDGHADTKDSVKAYKAAMESMHKDMNIAYTGNADVDFARGMIPHHQGAIDMAWVLNEHGRDPALQQIADDIIRSQGQEIALMQNWLEKHGNAPH